MMNVNSVYTSLINLAGRKTAAGLTEEEAKQYALEGKFRMLKKHSTLPRDVFEAHGLPGYVYEPSGYYNDEIYLNAARLGAELLIH